MAIRVPSAFVDRPARSAIVLIPAVLLSLTAGCGHHRSAMRPVFATPLPVATPATVVPESCPPATVTPSFGDSAVTPGSIDSPPPSMPASPGASGEPALEPVTPSSSSVPELKPPAEARRLRRSGGGSRASQRTALRSEVEPFVNDPSDLFLPPKADRPWQYVVLHHSASDSGSYAQIDRDQRKAGGYKGCGYHFVIGNGSESPDGQIEVARRWSDQRGGAHCRDGKVAEVNEYGIGICLVGDFNHTPPTPRQIKAARALVAYLQDRYAIPPAHVGTHAMLAQSPTACPGKNFPSEAIVAGRNLASR